MNEFHSPRNPTVAPARGELSLAHRAELPLAGLGAPSSSDPASWLDRAVRLVPDRTFIETTQGRRLTYRGMAELSRRLLAALARCDITAGDRVVVQVDKSAEAIALYLACLRIGAIFVPLNTAYTAHEFRYFIGDAEPKLIVVRPEDYSMAVSLVPEGDYDRIQSLGLTADGTLLAHSAIAADTAASDTALGPNLVAALLYTSGTTGKPKAAMLTRGNLASNAATLVESWRFTGSDVLLHALPIFHAHGLFVATNTVLASAASMIFLQKFDADEVLRLLPRSTVMMGVPTYYTRLLGDARLSPATTQDVRLFISGSAPLAAEHHREFARRTGHEILERYGMTETLMNTSNPYEGRRLPGSVGMALPGVEVRITDAESGSMLSNADAVGMIEVRGPNVFRGYWRNPAKTAADFRTDGFFITGDVGRIDCDGYLHIVGRAKDLIISGGYNVYPVEVEQELNTLQGVRESAVVGVPHPDFGEGVTAIIVRAEGFAALDESAVLGGLKGRLAKYKLPKRVLFTTELPRNAIGKVQKQLLREAYSDLYSVP